MKIVDINLLIYAINKDAPHHSIFFYCGFSSFSMVLEKYIAIAIAIAYIARPITESKLPST